MFWEILKVMIVFPLVIILLLFTLKSLQRLSGPVANNKQMKIIEQLRLTQKTNLSIVKIGKQHLVITCNDEHVQVIRELSHEEVAELEETQQSLSLENLNTAKWKDIFGRWNRE